MASAIVGTSAQPSRFLIAIPLTSPITHPVRQ